MKLEPLLFHEQAKLKFTQMQCLYKGTFQLYTGALHACRLLLLWKLHALDCFDFVIIGSKFSSSKQLSNPAWITITEDFCV